METVKAKNQIWQLKPTKEDSELGARYASVTLPWTFNRMMKQRSPRGLRERALNIAKGVAAQEALCRLLRKNGVQASTQVKSYRESDFYDLNVSINGQRKRLDFKTVNYYRDYDASVHRPSFSLDYLLSNSGYYGSDWRHFFPMLVPHTQIDQGKEVYCFGICESNDFRSNALSPRTMDWIAAFPYGEFQPFLSTKKLCLAREEQRKGFSIILRFVCEGLFSQSIFPLTVIGEWDGKGVSKDVVVGSDRDVTIGPLSCVSSFRVTRKTLESMSGHLELRVIKNDFSACVYNSSQENVNVIPNGSMTIEKDHFCNLGLPDDYTIYVTGWTLSSDFRRLCTKYSGWVWPDDHVSKFDNQPWIDITEKDRTMLSQHNFADAIPAKRSQLHAGFLKTTGKGGGACCYVFPNTFGGGVKETNLYVLLQDLSPMSEIGKDT